MSKEIFTTCADIGEEFTRIRQVYLKKVLVCRPDKGGDADVFREVQNSFEILRDGLFPQVGGGMGLNLGIPALR